MPKLFPDRASSPRPTQQRIDEIYKLATLSLESKVKKTETRLASSRVTSRDSGTTEVFSDSDSNDYTDDSTETEYYDEVHPINFGDYDSDEEHDNEEETGTKKADNDLADEQNQMEEKAGKEMGKTELKTVPKQEQAISVFQNNFHDIPEDEAEDDEEL